MNNNNNNEQYYQRYQHHQQPSSAIPAQPLSTGSPDEEAGWTWETTSTQLANSNNNNSTNTNLDNENRSSSRSSLRPDRRKQFDLTTPTLIDEEDELLEESFDEHRRTPGASMLKSVYGGGSAGDTVGVGGAGVGGSSSTNRNAPLPASLGFGLTLSTPVAESDKEKSVWGKDTDQRYKPALAPFQGQSSTRMGTSAGEPRGPFSFAPWSRAGQSASTPGGGEGTRSGAFSPTTLRISEDLGNLLQEDEDDDYALEIPSAFRGSALQSHSHALSTGIGEDWTGSYVFESNAIEGHANTPPVPRNYASHLKARRRSGQGQGSFLSHAQQPKPRRHEGFELGGKPRGDDRASPQLINFGGAFAPLGHGGTFLRPVASVGGGGESSFVVAQPGIGVVPQQHPHGYTAFRQGHLSPEPIYMAGPPDNPRFAPSPVYFVPAGSSQSLQQLKPSEMQATAREFVPMSTRSSTPQFNAPQWSQQPPPAIHYEPPQLEATTWQATPPNFRFIPTFTYTLAPPGNFPDPRAAMTPSPHLTAWQPAPQQVDPNAYNPKAMTHLEQQLARATMTPTPTHSIASLELSARDHAQNQLRKRDSKRGKKIKKKVQKEKADTAAQGKKTPLRKKGKGDVSRPESTTPSQGGNADEGAVSAGEEYVDTRRAELVESPATRIAFKEFYRAFRSEERLSFQKAEEFALGALGAGTVPDSVHWRVYLELADLAKRANRFPEARQLYQKVCELQPFAFQGWLEYSKLEEECGNLNRVIKILHAGLECCEYNETLMTRAVKLQEKMGNLGMARALLARLKHVGIHKVWKTVLEGALVEARAGNVSIARRVLKYLMHHVPWYGPLYLEAYRLERDQDHTEESLAVVERGLHAIPRYGPLWFGALRLCEELDIQNEDYRLPLTVEMVERATKCISKELVWKVHLEAAQMHERAAVLQCNVDDPDFDLMLDPARRRLALTVLTCPSNLRWKVWLAAARTELGFGNTERARLLFLRAHKVVPEKGRSATLLECARLEEFLGDTEFARAILCKGRREYGHDWKVWLESVLLEIRDRHFSRAIEICFAGLEIHSGTGRLWACLVQLEQYSGGDRIQQLTLRRALNAVPKSGEVWCEGGRIHLNPFSATFDVDRARRHLHFATKFTPQYGDSFVEGIRLEVVDKWLSPISDFVWQKTNAGLCQGIHEGKLRSYVLEMADVLFIASSDDEISATSPHRQLIQGVRKRFKNFHSCTNLSDLRLACVNADPNYGSLWFFCRRGASDSPRKVIEYAAELVAKDVQKNAFIYLTAMIRRKAILIDMPLRGISEGIETSDPGVMEWEDLADRKLMNALTLQDILKRSSYENLNGSLFVAGLSDLNNQQPVLSMTLAERKRALFGNDALFP